MDRWIASLIGLLVCGAALPQGADVGIVNFVSGTATFSSTSGSARKSLAAFSKIREGDRIELGAGAQVRVVYLDGSRQERWVGPASFVARHGASDPVSGKPAETTTLPAEVSQRIARVPDLVRFATLGGIQVRGRITPRQRASLEQQEALAKARVTYQSMRKDAGADDLTPEFFLYAALHEYLLYDDMKTVVDEMLRRQPESEDARTLSAFVHEKLSKRR